MKEQAGVERQAAAEGRAAETGRSEAEAAVLEPSRSEPKKLNRHVVIALNHMNQRRKVLLEKRAELTREIEELDAAILALG